ncbi:MAG: adenylate cyclase [Alphaproteobacteria bacterium]
MWAERYDRDLEDIFDLQDEITDTIVGRIEPELGAAERHRVERKPRTDLQTWDCFHLGMSNFYKFTAAGNQEAQRLLKRSSELDPDFGDAHAWWAYAVVLGMVYWDTEPDDALLDEALAAAQRALEIDDQNAVFYALMARINLARRDYAAALSGNAMAIKLNPTFAVAYCAMGDSLAYEGRYDEAISQFEKAVALSPNEPQRWAFLSYGALAKIFNEDFESALQWSERASVIPNHQYWTQAHMVVALAHLDRLEEAGRVVAKLLIKKPGFTCAFAEKKLFYIKRPEQLALYIDGLRKAGLPES